MRLVLLLCLITACGKQRPQDESAPDDSTDPALEDGDGDGYDGRADCDDEDPDVFPGQAETCDRLDNDCDGEVDEDPTDGTGYMTDGDGDGYGVNESVLYSCTPIADRVTMANDCDDGDALVHPGATELCDGADNNCDGDTDGTDAIDGTLWYRDDDGDTYGINADYTRACSQPAGYGPERGDCDDSNGDIHPLAPEYCDGFDNDCDSLRDEDNAVDAPDWYLDSDADGYGDPLLQTTACEEPPGYVADPGDCDDSDDEVNPDATESCDGFDNDCDGGTDEADAIDAVTWTYDGDRDGFGDPQGSTLVACTRPSTRYASDATDCDDGDATVFPGAAEVCGDGVVNDCDATEAEATASCGLIGTMSVANAQLTLVGETSTNYAGSVVDAAGDVDGDGLPDVIVGAYQNSNGGGTLAGAAYLVRGGTSGSLGLASADAILTGEVARDNAGISVAGLGDFDGDGYDDVAVGATGYDISLGSSAGAAYVALGPLSGTASLSTAIRYSGAAAYDAAGTDLSRAGDFNGDGYADLLVGAESADGGGTGSGGAYLIFGESNPASASLSTADLLLVGEDAQDGAGGNVGGGGDYDGDGLDDVLVGATGDDTGASGVGAVYLILGGASGTMDLSAADQKVYATTSGEGFGSSMTLGGDFDGDGHDDLVVGSTANATAASNAGIACLWLGGTVIATRSIATADACWTGPGTADSAGDTVRFAGDTSGDGLNDLLIGAHNADTTTGTTGAGYLILGQANPAGTSSLTAADATIEGAAAYDYAGQSLAGAGDFFGDGRMAVLIGAYGADGGGSSSGGAYLLSGQSY